MGGLPGGAEAGGAWARGAPAPGTAAEEPTGTCICICICICCRGAGTGVGTPTPTPGSCCGPPSEGWGDGYAPTEGVLPEDGATGAGRCCWSWSCCRC